MLRIWMTLTVGMMLTAPAFAGAPLPELEGVVKTQQSFGHGTLRFMWMDIYEAELWTDAPEWSMETPFALSLTYDASFSSLELADRSVKEMANITDLSEELQNSYRSSLLQNLPDIKAGDRLTAVWEPGKSVKFFHNGVRSGEIAIKGFAEAFFGIWLSPNTSEPALRDALLHRSNP